MSCKQAKQRGRRGAPRRKQPIARRGERARRFATQNTATSKGLAQTNKAFPYWIDTHFGTLLQVVKTTNQFVTRTRSLFRLSTAYSERWGRLRKFAVGSILEPAVYTPCLVSYPYGGTINFETVSKCNSEFTNLRFEELLKLQLRLIGISDIEGMKL